jgi:hypothetical protein
MKRTAIKNSVVLLLLLLFSRGPASAQQEQGTRPPANTSAAEAGAAYVVPARPTVSNPAEFQRPGVLQMEFGFNSNFRAAGVSSEWDAPLALRYAVSSRLLFEFDGDSPFRQRLTGGAHSSGIGDTALGVQGVLRHRKGTRPGVALAYYVKLPTADARKGLGTGRFDHSFITLLSDNFGKTTVDFNAIYLLAGRAGGGGRASSGQAALAASRAVTRRVGLQSELSGFGRNDTQAGAFFVLGAVTYQVNRRLVFDGGLRTGLTEGATRVGAFAGLTVGLADFRRASRRGDSGDGGARAKN